MFSGSGFSDTIADNLVMIGDSNCVVSAASASEITCQIATDEQPDIGMLRDVVFEKYVVQRMPRNRHIHDIKSFTRDLSRGQSSCSWERIFLE